MNKTSFRALSLIFFTCASISAPTTPLLAAAVEAYEERVIGNISVTLENPPPLYSFDSKLIVSRLKTKVGDPFSQTTFDNDLKALSDEYDRVEPSIDVVNGEVYITLKLWPRPTIRTINWYGNQFIKTKTLQKELGIKASSSFNRQTFNSAFNKLKEYYVKKGYFESQLNYRVVSDTKTNEVDIEISITEGRSGKIDKIVFKGFTSEEESELLDMIHTKKYNFFTNFVLGTGIFNEEALEQDNLTIVNLLQNNGYADARVDIQILESSTQGKIIIEITADRGPVFHFGEITFEGNTLFTDQEIENHFLVHPEDTYSPEKLRETTQYIKDLYGRKGHIDASVQYETQLAENAPIYNVRFTIEEGQKYKIGMIRIVGNSQTQARVILHESLLIPGETFDSAKLKATQARLENIGYFKNVNVYAVRTQDDQSLGESYRDVFIEVEETHTGSISLFSGFSSADNIFGGIDISESNFNYRGLGKVFSKGASAVRGGGEYAQARINVGAKQQNYTVSWLTPYFRDTLWRVGVNGELGRSGLQAKDYTIRTLGGSVFASYPLTPYWSFNWRYRIRESSTQVDHGATKRERQEARSGGLLSSSGVSLNYDSTDSALKPHNGFRSLIESEFTGIGGDFTFLRFGYINSFYQQLWRRGIMKYRAEFRFIEPVIKTHHADDIPMSERFFLGGENSVRGYKAFDLGPRFSNGDPTGGISSSLFSVEYLQEIFKVVDGFVFADAGAVSMKRFRVGHYNLSYGFGVRLELINRVPVILGMGFPVNPDNHGQVRKFFFSMGGQF
ncbi:MAG: outer membrane protein assembly factor BamA [Chlamydiales bacterium]|nr:outer membrane protein assembly factor BamA [Chlamydiales bacterium]